MHSQLNQQKTIMVCGGIGSHCHKMGVRCPPEDASPHFTAVRLDTRTTIMFLLAVHMHYVRYVFICLFISDPLSQKLPVICWHHQSSHFTHMSCWKRGVIGLSVSFGVRAAAIVAENQLNDLLHNLRT